MNTRQVKKPNVRNECVQSPTVALLVAKESQESHIESRLDDLKALLVNVENRIMSTIGALTAEMTNVRSDIKAILLRVEAVEKCSTAAVAELDKLHSRVGSLDSITINIEKKVLALTNTAVVDDDIKARVNVLENERISSDCIIFNVPNEADADVVVKRALTELKCENLQVCKVLRLRSRTNATSPIILKLRNAQERIQLFKALAIWRKNAKRQLCLSDIGFTGSSSVAIHECLTTVNREILQSALKIKAEKKLSAVFSTQLTHRAIITKRTKQLLSICLEFSFSSPSLGYLKLSKSKQMLCFISGMGA